MGLTREGLNRKRTAAALLTDEDVRVIRANDRDRLVSRIDMADWYGVGRETISRICRRETYNWVQDATTLKKGAVRVGSLLTGEISEVDRVVLNESAQRLFNLQEQWKREGVLADEQASGDSSKGSKVEGENR